MDCLLLEFRIAGIFNPERSKDKVFDINGSHERQNFPFINIPIGTLSKRHISNVLHVLMGERPVPSLRASLMNPVEDIKALADDSRVFINSIILENKDKKQRYLSETKTVQKSVYNAWAPRKYNIILKGKSHKFEGRILTWTILKIYLQNTNLYNRFISIIKKELGSKFLSEKLLYVIEILSNHTKKLTNFINECEKMGKKPFSDLIKGETKNSTGISRFKDPRCRLTITRGIEKISRIDGFIYIPMKEEHFERIRKGPGTATFLEGGIIFIRGKHDFSENLIFGTTKPVE